jgi:hypothetical protein
MTNPMSHGPQKTAQKRPRHGLYATLAAVKLRGLEGIDKRTSAARALLQWRARLLADLGGAEAISAQRVVLVDVACRTKAMLDHVDEWLLARDSIINKRARTLLPIVRERQALADSLARVLGQLGIERVAAPAPSLADYVAAKDREKVAETPSSEESTE